MSINYKNRSFAIIPYASITSDHISNSIYSNIGQMSRAKRGIDEVICVFLTANKSAFSGYILYDYSDLNKFTNSSSFNDKIPSSGIDFMGLLSNHLKTSLTQEIYDLEITTAGATYSAGTLTATGGGGGGFKGSYTVSSGAIDTVTIVSVGGGYTSAPTIVISDSGDGNAVITPKLRIDEYSYIDDTTLQLDFDLQDDLTYASTLTIDKDSTATATSTTKGLSIDYDHTGIAASGQTLNNIGLDIAVNSDSPTMVGTVSNKGINIVCQGGTTGVQTNTALNIVSRDADTNNGIYIQCNGDHLKLVATADTDDYATFSLADTGDLTIATVGDGTTDSDLTLDVDGDIILEAAGRNITADAPIAVTNTTSPQLELIYSLTNKITFGISANGTTTLTTSGIGTTASDLILDVDGDIVLDSANGIFIAKNAGTEFSAANSSYAGMVLGYTDIGLNETLATYDLTTSYAVPTSEFAVTFVIPPSRIVEIFIQVTCSMGSSNSGDLYAGLSDNASYNAVASYHEVEVFDAMSRGAWRTLTHTWTLSPAILGPAGESETIWVGFKSSSTTGTPLLSWGGDATNLSPDFIMKATALPATIST